MEYYTGLHTSTHSNAFAYSKSSSFVSLIAELLLPQAGYM